MTAALWMIAGGALYVIYYCWRRPRKKPEPIISTREDDWRDAMGCLYGASELVKEMRRSQARAAKTYADYLRAKLLREAEAKHKERMMKVTYSVIHHSDKPCERIPTVPDGYEKVSAGDMKRGDLYINHGFWDTAGDSRLECARRNGEMSGLFIRPIRPAAELVEGAYYEVEGGAIFRYHHDARVNLGGIKFEFGRHSLLGIGRIMPYIAPRILRRVWISDTESPYVKAAEDVLKYARKIAEDFARPAIRVCENGVIDCGKYDVCKKCHEHFNLVSCGKCRYVFPVTQKCPQCAKPFRLSGPGWYRTRGGAWVKDPLVGSPCWEPSGKWLRAGGDCELDLIARATYEQARVLDGL